MELKFSTFDSFLIAVKSVISAELEDAKKILQTSGKSIDTLNDIFVNSNNELFDLLPDGTLVRVNLYIATKSVDSYALNSVDSANLYKYHIYRCSTIANMFNSGRKYRYRINNRDDGKFYFTFTDFRGKILRKEENQKLNICKNCLKKFLNLQYASDQDVQKFQLKAFHQQHNNFFDVHRSDEMEESEYLKTNFYSEDWNRISTQLKTKLNYRCSACGFQPRNSYEKRFIHTHHINGNKNNNYEDNLKVLCIKCHSEVDVYHARIKSTDNYKEFLKHLEL